MPRAPAAFSSGIMSRIAGYRYTIRAIDHALKTGDSAYYFHPFEIGSYPKVKRLNMKTRIFLRRLGQPYYRMLERLLDRYQGQFTPGEKLLAKRRGPSQTYASGKLS